MKKIYVNPAVNCVLVNEEDIIRTSITFNDPIVDSENQDELPM